MNLIILVSKPTLKPIDFKKQATASKTTQDFNNKDINPIM
jgi:hypothetical protein